MLVGLVGLHDSHYGQVSGIHCSIISDFRQAAPRLEVEDASTNGTFLDDVKLTKAQQLAWGLADTNPCSTEIGSGYYGSAAGWRRDPPGCQAQAYSSACPPSQRVGRICFQLELELQTLLDLF